MVFQLEVQFHLLMLLFHLQVATEKISIENLVHQMPFFMPELKMMMRIQISSLVIKLQELELSKIQRHTIQLLHFHYQKQVLFMQLD